MNRKLLMTGLIALVGLAVSVPALWAQMEADALFRDFEPTGDFQLELDGSVVKDAEIYRSDRSGAYLIMGPQLKSPVLINTRTRQVETVSLLKVAKRDTGKIDLLADASFDSLGPFQVGNKELTFDLKGQKAVLSPRPWLLGGQTATSLVDYNASYGFKSKAYTANAQQIASLRKQQRDVKVKVYFGSWCPVCSRLVPNIIKVEEELAGSKLDFSYYGLPSPMSDDPVTAEKNLRGVPTVVVEVNGKEIGRLNGQDLDRPESSLERLLSGS